MLRGVLLSGTCTQGWSGYGASLGDAHAAAGAGFEGCYNTVETAAEIYE